MAEVEDFQIDRSITGDKPQFDGSQRGTPATAAEFLAATDAILALPRVEAVRWRQATPYFNDGDPCEFSVHELYVRLAGMDVDEEGEEYGDYGDGFLSSWELIYYTEQKRFGFEDLPKDLIGELEVAIRNWEKLYVDEVCKRNFGDHAVVTATTGGFEIEYYEHD